MYKNFQGILQYDVLMLHKTIIYESFKAVVTHFREL